MFLVAAMSYHRTYPAPGKAGLRPALPGWLVKLRAIFPYPLRPIQKAARAWVGLNPAMIVE